MRPHAALRGLGQLPRCHTCAPVTLAVRTFVQKAKPKPKLQAGPAAPELPQPEDHRRSWFWTANRISNFAVIPSTFLPCISCKSLLTVLYSRRAVLRLLRRLRGGRTRV